MILDMIVFIGFALVMMLLIAFFYFRDKAVFQKLSAYEEAIDDLHNRLYTLETERAEGGVGENQEIVQALEQVEVRLEDRLNELGDPLLRTIRAVKTMEGKLLALEERLNARLSKLESSSSLGMQGSVLNLNEDRIISLFKEGKSIEKIAKKERISQGEVEFVLRMANLR